MPDPGPLPPQILPGGAGEQELGTPRFAWFEGILEAAQDDPQGVRSVVAQINRIGYVAVDLELRGGRLSLLLDPAVHAGTQLGPRQREAFIHALGRLSEVLPSGVPIESTLRSTEVFQGTVRETLFAFAGSALQALTRLRPVTPEDLERAPRSQLPVLPLDRIGRRRLLLLFGLFALGFALVAWQSGFLDRLLTPSASSLEIQEGPFQGLLAVEKERSWGRYQVIVRRGPSFPANPAEIDKLLERATDLKTRAAINTVAGGGAIFVRLAGEEGRVLEAVRLELSPLLAGTDGKATAVLSGRMGAAYLQLALDSGREAP